MEPSTTLSPELLAQLRGWEGRSETNAIQLQTPHARDFVRVEAAPGPHTLRVTLREHRR